MQLLAGELTIGWKIFQLQKKGPGHYYATLHTISAATTVITHKLYRKLSFIGVAKLFQYLLITTVDKPGS